MKLVIEEICATHPAGKAPGEFRRVRCDGDIVIDSAAAQLIMARKEDDPLWLAADWRSPRRLMIVLAHRLCVVADDVCLVVDVCTSELYEAIKNESRRYALGDYVSWAESRKVWL